MKTKKCKFLGVLLCISIFAGTMGAGRMEMLKVHAESLSDDQQAEKIRNELGEGWECIWNGASDILNADFVEVVSTEHHNGAYALRIGHPEADTSFTLRRTIDVSEEGAYEWNAWFKRSGSMEEGSAVYIKKGIDGVGDDIKGYSLAGAEDSEWFQVMNDNPSTDMWIDGDNPVCIEISVICKAGSYLYIDDLEVFRHYWGAKPKELISGFSFENTPQEEKEVSWTVLNQNGVEDTSLNRNLTDYINFISLENEDGYALRIGHPSEKTDLRLRCVIPVTEDTVFKWSASVRCVGVLDEEKSAIYIKNGVIGDGANASKKYGLKGNSAWISLQNTDNGGSATDMWVGGTGEDGLNGKLCLDLVVACEPGNYLYIKDFTLDSTTDWWVTDSQAICGVGFEKWVEAGVLQAYADATFPDKKDAVADMIVNAIDGIKKAKTYDVLNQKVNIAMENMAIFANSLKLNVGGTQIRNPEDESTLRFVLELDKEFYDYMVQQYGDVEFGTLVARSDLYPEGELTYSNVTNKLVGDKATTIKHTKVYELTNYSPRNEHGETTVYTCVVRNIPNDYWNTAIRARNYLKYTNAEGAECYFYGEEHDSSYQDIYNKTQNLLAGYGVAE